MQYIIYSVGFYFVLLFLAGILAFEKTFKKSLQLFVLANIIGLSAGVVYFAKFFGQSLTLANFDLFFHFQPTLTLLSVIFFTLISGVSALVGIYSTKYLELYKKTYSQNSVEFLMAFFVLGMQGVLLANNAFAFLFFWEVMSITSFFLVMSDKTQESIKASFLYFIMTHLGASAILGGFLILGNGNLLSDFSSIGEAVKNLSPAMAGLAFSLFLFGFGSKAGLAPFHVWLPEAHPQAPSNISAMMSGLMLKVAVYGFIMVAFNFAGLGSWAAIGVMTLGILSALIGVLNAVVETDIKRAFAYSSIENMGLIFTMLGLALYVSHQGGKELATISAAIIAFAIFHAISHAMFKTALFLSSGVVMARVHTKNMNVMGGLAKLMPIFSVGFLLAILSSLPLPPFGTFFGEWGFLQNIIQLMHVSKFGISSIIIFLTILTVIGLIGGLAVFAMIKIFAISMLGLPRTKHIEHRSEKAEYALSFPIIILALGGIVLGIFAKPIIAAFMSQANNLVLQEVKKQTMPIISSQFIFAAVLFFVFLVIAMKKIAIKKQTERAYHTWDCGQPIDASMEYTATAFSAPIRFFFLKFVGRNKKLESQPVAETNPWIRNYTFTLELKSIWKDAVYAPLANAFVAWAEKLKRIQSGRIQYYLLFLLFTLILTLMIAL